MWNDNSGLGRPPTTLLHPWQLKDKISHAACCLLPAEVFSNLRLETQPKTTENSASFDSWWPPEATAERPGALCSVFATPLHRLKSTLQHFSTVHPELLVGFLSRFQYPSIHCWRKPAMCSIYICRLSIEGYSPTHTYYCSYIMFCTQCVYAAYKSATATSLFMSIPWIRASSWRTYSPQEVIYIDLYCILLVTSHHKSQWRDL